MSWFSLLFWILAPENHISPSSGLKGSALKMETVYFSEMLASIHESTRCKNREQ
jgi:hypothetical protein